MRKLKQHSEWAHVAGVAAELGAQHALVASARGVTASYTMALDGPAVLRLIAAEVGPFDGAIRQDTELIVIFKAAYYGGMQTCEAERNCKKAYAKAT